MSRDHNSPEPRDMGVQVPCRVHAEVPQEGVVWANPASPGYCIPRAGPAQGMPDRGRAPDARPCAHADIDPAEILGVGGDRPRMPVNEDGSPSDPKHHWNAGS